MVIRKFINKVKFDKNNYIWFNRELYLSIFYSRKVKRGIKSRPLRWYSYILPHFLYALDECFIPCYIISSFIFVNEEVGIDIEDEILSDEIIFL